MKIQSNTTNGSFFTLLLMISFASVNAVLFTPALPDIATFFAVPARIAQHTISWFLIGYALGQLLYGPLANRYGRKPALYAGIILQIVSSLLCVAAGLAHVFSLLVLGRLLLALGSGVGLKMTFTLVNEYYSPEIAKQKIAYLMMSFAIAPGLAVALGGLLNTYWGWMSCFLAGALYGILLLWRSFSLPETQHVLDTKALQVTHLIHEYALQFKTPQLIAGGLLMGSSTCFIYIFAALGPFIAINIFGMSSAQYGLANILPLIGLVAGLFCSARLAEHYTYKLIIPVGIVLAAAGVGLLIAAMALHLSPLAMLFLPLLVIYLGISLILPNASMVAMNSASDKAHGSAVMNFLNMGLATVVVLGLGLIHISAIVLPLAFVFTSVLLLGFYKWMASEARG